MRRLLTGTLLLLLLLAVLPIQGAAHAQGNPKIDVTSTYTLNRYGFATIDESVTVTNNGTSSIQVPNLTIGFGNLSSKVVQTNITSGFSMGTPPSTGGPFSVSSALSIQPGANVTFALNALINGVVYTAKNGSLQVLTLSSPSIDSRVDNLLNVVQMPSSTSFKTPPAGLTANFTASVNRYTSKQKDVIPQNATTSVRDIAESSTEDFNPLHIFYVQRTITAGSNGKPLVTDKIEFENLGTIPLSQIYVSLLAPNTTQVTIVTATASQPVLLNPFQISLSNGAIDLATFAVGYPSDGVQVDTNFTLTYQYPLGSSYYSVSSGKVTLHIPETPPVNAFIDEFDITLSVPRGAIVVQSTPQNLSSVTPWQTGETSFAYTLSVGWFLSAGVPLASVVFVFLLIGLFVARSATGEKEEAEEEEEETSTELASGMIQAFDEKTDLINGLWSEIEGADPNELDKAYFDELRGRLDSFRNRALQRLNEVKQKSASQRFSDVVTQIQATEREVDRAAKDKLNLYQQYHLKQMRKEVYDRLHPQYTKRLERALNQLSDELHTVQREAKLL